ncbi:hypothetical protein BOX15_Mlig029262g1, partial [Macrostomum lignano]
STQQKTFSLVVAAATNGVIGRDGGLPWGYGLKTDLKFFRLVTSGPAKPSAADSRRNLIIMGRRTWDSLPRKPLPNRLSVVLTRSPDELQPRLPDGVRAAASLDAALALADPDGPLAASVAEIHVIGGAAVYAEAARHPRLGRIYFTRVFDDNCIGDCRFPDSLDWSEFVQLPPDRLPEHLRAEFSFDRQIEAGLEFQFTVWDRRGDLE